MSQENYLTGQFRNNSQQSSQNKNKQTTNTINLSSTNSQKYENQNPEPSSQQDHHNQQQQINQQSVNIQDVTVQPQQIQQEKFIQNNPQVAAQNKKTGNNHYNSKQYVQALEFYRKALQYTDRISQENKKFCSIIYSNIGLTYMKMNQQESSIQYFQNSLKLNQNYTKARTNLAQCYQSTQKFQQALQQYKKVLELTPNDLFIKQKVQSLSVKVHQIQQKRKQEVIGGLKNIGNSILGFFGMSLDNFKLQKGPGGGYNISMKQ